MYSLCVVLLAFFAVICSARNGVDLSVKTDLATWNCLVSNNVSFAIIRAYRSLGAVDTNAPETIGFARKAGVSSVDAYMFPCIQTSAYAVSHNLTCASAEQQVTDTLDLLASSPVGRIWIDVEDETPSKYYDSNPEVNQRFMSSLVASLTAHGSAVGIYTTKTYWTNIMANDLSYGAYPLWYPRYDSVDSFDFFAPFAAWEHVDIKQTMGDAPLCNISQVDTDFIQE